MKRRKNSLHRIRGPSVDPVPSVDCYVKVGLSANNALLGNPDLLGSVVDLLQA